MSTPSPTLLLAPPPPLPSTSAQQELDLDEREREELTTKGRKRKRLAKACSACHKNKRRCDGFAPCSNCEFSARSCLYLNSAGEPIPPPRTRDSSTTPSGAVVAVTTPVQAKKAGPSRLNNVAIAPAGAGPGIGTGPKSSRRLSVTDGEQSDVREMEKERERQEEFERERERDKQRERERERPSRPSVVDLVDRDAALSAELLQLFFDRLPPFSTMFHPPTFYHRHYLGLVPSFLLDAIFALSARLCPDPKLDTPDGVTWSRGEAFAERAQIAIDRRVDERRSWSEEERRRDVGTWEETEFAQASCLLSFYHTCLRSPRLALSYLDIGIATLHPSTVRHAPSSQYNLSPLELFTLRETRTRTLWILFLHDCCAAANGRPRRLFDNDMRGISLPGKESAWTRWGGAGAGRVEPRRRDGLQYDSGDWPGEDGEIGEIGHVLRILVIFGNIMAVSNNGGAGNPDARTVPVQYHERALKSWAISLPSHLQFNENNLRAAIAKQSSPLAAISGAGWMYAYMHSLAECGMFYLQVVAAAAVGTAVTAQRQAQAVDNLSVIVNSIGERGREPPLMLFPLTVIANWVDHLRASQSYSTPQQQSMESSLKLWWGEANRLWGLERETVLEKGFYPVARADRRSSAPIDPGYYPRQALQSAAPVSAQRPHFTEDSLGLYHSEAAAGAGSGASRPSPLTLHAAAGGPSRQRNGSVSTHSQPPPLNPSPPRRDSRPSSELSKPSLPPFREYAAPSPLVPSRETYTSNGHYSPEHDQPRDRRASLQAPQSYRYQPYARPIEAPAKTRDSSSPRQWEASRDNAQFLGIAALVSAAEERSKERLFAPPSSEVTQV